MEVRRKAKLHDVNSSIKRKQQLYKGMHAGEKGEVTLN